MAVCCQLRNPGASSSPTCRSCTAASDAFEGPQSPVSMAGRLQELEASAQKFLHHYGAGLPLTGGTAPCSHAAAVPRRRRSPASSAALISTPKATAHCRHRVGSAAAAGGRLCGGVLCRLRLLERAAPDGLQGVRNHTFDLLHFNVKQQSSMPPLGPAHADAMATPRTWSTLVEQALHLLSPWRRPKLRGTFSSCTISIFHGVLSTAVATAEVGVRFVSPEQMRCSMFQGVLGSCLHA